MRWQRGVTLIGLIFFLALATIVALLAFRVVPFYVDYFTMRSVLQNLATEKRDATDREFYKDFEMRASANYLNAFSAKDLNISRDHGILTLSVQMTDKKPVGAGISLLMELEAKGSAIQK